MVMSWIWTGILCISLTSALFLGRGSELAASIMAGSQAGITLAISMGGAICLWTGVGKLMEHSGIVPRERLLEVLWDDGGKFIDDNTLSVHMSRLREKTGAEHIRTIRGVGYQWSD